MESRVNYTIVGLFVILLMTGLFSFAFWLQKNSGQQEYDHYLVYISESVAGLSPDASVRYRGVNVGTVEKISIDSDNSEQVKLLLKIVHNTPIKQNATATLNFFGLTGLAYIELAGSTKDSPLLKGKKDAIPVIPSTPTTFTRVNNSLTSLAFKSEQILDKLNRLLNNKNLNEISGIFTEINALTSNINAQMPKVQKLLTNGASMEKNMNDSFAKVAIAADSVDRMASSLQKNYVNVGHTMTQDIKQSLIMFNELIRKMDDLVDQLQQSVEVIETSPGDIFFKRSEPKPGPGEDGYDEK